MQLQFGDFTLNDQTRLLLRERTAVHLSPKAFDLLVALIGDRPRLLSKADLHARLWPKTFVSDASLAMVVAEVRAALGETARQPACIRTVHRHGYAFQGTAREVEIPQASLPRLITGAAKAAIQDEAAIGYWLVTEARQISLVPGDNIVGRDPGARVFLDAPSVSRRHARIRVEADRATLEDLGSKNGTRVRDTQLKGATELYDGDALRFGSVNATFKAWTADPTRTEAERLG